MGLTIRKGDILTEKELDDAVHEVQLHALSIGMIPIAGIMSRRMEKKRGKDARHEVLGFGWNRLREGIPGIHGETGAIMNMGRIDGGYRDVVATSSLNPCPFCQRALACHLGVSEVRILDTVNYSPDLKSYRAVGLKPTALLHEPTAKTFGAWVTDPANATIWNRDIGLYEVPVTPPFDVRGNPDRTVEIMSIADRIAQQGLESGEAPIGAAVVDPWGEVLGVGHARVIADNDPSCVAAMAAWRACGARDHWKDKTLFLTCGPDHIAYSMFHIFGFGQLVVGSGRVFSGEFGAVRDLGAPVHLLRAASSDALLKAWIQRTPAERVREYLGADWQA